MCFPRDRPNERSFYSYVGSISGTRTLRLSLKGFKTEFDRR
jgi:hypothetical protein